MSDTAVAVDWQGDDRALVEGFEFLVTEDPSIYRSVVTDDDCFLLVKTPDHLRAATDRFTALAPRHMVELGVYQGGSVAFWNLVLRPERHLAVDLYDRSVTALDDFVGGDRHHGRLATRWFDQTDEPALTAALDDVFEGEALDLVIDDASHYYFPTRASFETIFPRLRPGGLYVVEDWGWAHKQDMSWDVDGRAGNLPALSNLLVEISMACASSPDVVSRIEVWSNAFLVERGPAPLDAPLTLASLYTNRGIPFRALL